MNRRASLLVCGLAIAALVLGVGVGQAHAAGAVSILQGEGLRYVKHVNDLPPGTTTLWVRSTECFGVTTLARIYIAVKAEDGSELSRTIFASFTGGEQKKFVINWGQPVTDLNFIQITPIKTVRPVKTLP